MDVYPLSECLEKRRRVGQINTKVDCGSLHGLRAQQNSHLSLCCVYVCFIVGEVDNMSLCLLPFLLTSLTSLPLFVLYNIFSSVSESTHCSPPVALLLQPDSLSANPNLSLVKKKEKKSPAWPSLHPPLLITTPRVTHGQKLKATTINAKPL